MIHDYHTNAMKLFAYNEDGKLIDEWLVFSVGGGTIMEEGQARIGGSDVYSLSTMEDIMKWCKDNNKELWEYVVEMEGEEIWDYLDEIWQAMQDSVRSGLSKSDILPGDLKYPRKAQTIYRKATKQNTPDAFRARSSPTPWLYQRKTAVVVG